MSVGRRLGILVFCAVPAIIGGGIIHWLTGSYVPVAVYQAVLLLGAVGLISK